MHPQRFLLLVHALIWAAFGALIGLIILDAKLKVWTQAEPEEATHAILRHSYDILYAAMQHRKDFWLRSKQYPGWMVALAACCMVALLTTLAIGITGIRRAVLSKKHW